MKLVLVLLPIFVAASMACMGSDASSDTPAQTEGDRIDQWALDFCEVLLGFGQDVGRLSAADPIAYFQSVSDIAERNGNLIAEVAEVSSTRAFQASAADGLLDLHRALDDSIPRLRDAITRRDAAAVATERDRITAVLDRVQSITTESLKLLPPRAVSAINLVPGCIRPNLLAPAATSG